MKKVLLALALLFGSFTFIACDDDDDKKLSVDELPEIVQIFLQTHFSGQEVRLVEKDNDSYDVYLINGFKVEFNLSGEWDDIDGQTMAIPQSILDLIPESISDYVTEHYSGFHISEINKERYGYEIELNNGLDLKFDSEGVFIGLDN